MTNSPLGIDVKRFEYKHLEPLHELYNDLVLAIPHHPKVTFKQFSDELLTMSWDEAPGVFSETGHIELVAEKAGRPVAFACGSFCHQDSTFYKASTGLLRFLLAGPEDGDACQVLIRAIVRHLKAFSPTEIVALDSFSGPLFHNWGRAMLSDSWPWVGRCLQSEGFATGDSRVKLYRSLSNLPISPVLPDGAEFRPNVGRGIGTHLRQPAEHEYSHLLVINDELAAQCVSYFSEMFVDNANSQILYISWLFVEEAFRGRKLGQVMITRAMEAAERAGATGVVLYTQPDNFPALGVYRSLGLGIDDFLWEFKLTAEEC